MPLRFEINGRVASCRFEAFNLATLQGATARLVDTIRNAEGRATQGAPRTSRRLWEGPPTGKTKPTTELISCQKAVHKVRQNCLPSLLNLKKIIQKKTETYTLLFQLLLPFTVPSESLEKVETHTLLCSSCCCCRCCHCHETMQKMNPLATPKHHLISCRKGVKKGQQNCLTSLLNL